MVILGSDLRHFHPQTRFGRDRVESTCLPAVPLIPGCGGLFLLAYFSGPVTSTTSHSCLQIAPKRKSGEILEQASRRKQRQAWEYKLGLWRREVAQAEQDRAAAKLSSSRGRSGTP
jgi:hypothetical protein